MALLQTPGLKQMMKHFHSEHLEWNSKANPSLLSLFRKIMGETPRPLFNIFVQTSLL